MKKSLIKKMLTVVCSLGIVGLCSFGAQAGLISSVFDGFTQFQDNGSAEDIKNQTGSSAFTSVDPGVGGQMFDAEYLLYKQEGKMLSLGLQTGFDLSDGEQSASSYSQTGYFAGDLALSFDGTASTGVGNSSTFEFAVDFDFENSGTDPALYKDVTWSADTAIHFKESNPYRMVSGTLVPGLAGSFGDNGANGATAGWDLSYYRIVTIDLSTLGIADWADGLTLDAHWTMSCGNDAIDGSFTTAPVPEPATMLLFGTGLIGLAGVARKRKMKK